MKSISNYKHLLLHIPHSSTRFPNKHQFAELNEDERLLIDYYTDELFLPSGEMRRVESSVFPYCRLYCDVERLAHDPLEEKGLGIRYTHEGMDSPAFSDLRSDEVEQEYVMFHTETSMKLLRLRDAVLLIDCHSFSAFPTRLVPMPQDIDICIGYNDDWSKPQSEILELIQLHFLQLGYKVGLNVPFSNSKTFEIPMVYHSVMIEVNKRLYMNEQTLKKTSMFDKLHNEILSLYGKLLSNQ